MTGQINSQPEIPPVSTIKQFCDYLQIDRTCLQDNFLYRKDFPAYKVGRNWRIKTAAALAYVESKGAKRR